MAFALSVAYYSGVQTQSLTDHNPYFMEGATGISSAPVRRYTQHSPTQNGVTDLGFYITPRILTLTVFFYATTDSQLDTYRSTLYDIFRPSWSVTLTLTRDDAATRSLSCVVVDEVAIELDPYDRASKLHRATITLRADDPRWYNPTAGTASYTGSTAQVWWNAGGMISNNNAVEHNDLVTLSGQSWTYAGTITGSWSVVFRTTLSTVDTATAFHAGTGALQAANTKDARFYYKSGSAAWMVDGNAPTPVIDPGGTPNIMYVRDSSIINGNSLFVNDTGNAGNIGNQDFDISGSTRKWRSDRSGSAATFWGDQLEKAAVYDIALSSAQRTALNGWMNGYPLLGTISVVNAGDTNEYPVITLQGPLYNPIIINSTTASTIDLTGFNLGSGDVYTIDLRYGDKRITNNFGSSLLGSAGTAMPFQLASFYLAPAPTASGGTNNVTVRAGSMTTNTLVQLTYYNRYMSW